MLLRWLQKIGQASNNEYNQSQNHSSGSGLYNPRDKSKGFYSPEEVKDLILVCNATLTFINTDIRGGDDVQYNTEQTLIIHALAEGSVPILILTNNQSFVWKLQDMKRWQQFGFVIDAKLGVLAPVRF